jgi:Flp pilus assembly protein TadB
VKLPTPATPGAAARRSLLFDLVAALAITLVALLLAAGIGVVGFFALPAALLLIAWYGTEAGLRRVLRRRRGPQRRFSSSF